MRILLVLFILGIVSCSNSDRYTRNKELEKLAFEAGFYGGVLDMLETGCNLTETQIDSCYNYRLKLVGLK